MKSRPQNPHLDMPRRLTVSQQEAARLLGLCVDTIDAMAQRGELERVRLSQRKFGITWRSLERLVGQVA